MTYTCPVKRWSGEHCIREDSHPPTGAHVFRTANGDLEAGVPAYTPNGLPAGWEWTPLAEIPGLRLSEPERAGREGDTQAMPTPNGEVDTQSVAIKLIEARRQVGIKRYGTALQPNNGRDSLWDAVEESLDMLVYLINFWREQNPGKPIPGLEETP